jgi:hypothetical protein
MICFFILHVVYLCKLVDGAEWEWDESNIVEKFRGKYCVSGGHC